MMEDACICTMKGCYELTEDSTTLCQSCRDYVFDKIRGVSTTIRPAERLATRMWRLMPKTENGKCFTSMGIMDKEQFQEFVSMFVES